MASGEEEEGVKEEKEGEKKEQREQDDEELIPRLREVSRQEYLKKRERQKLEDLREAIEDEENLFRVCCKFLLFFFLFFSFVLFLDTRLTMPLPRAELQAHEEGEGRFGVQEESVQSGTAAGPRCRLGHAG